MIRGLIRLALIVVVLVAAAFFLFGYWTGDNQTTPAPATGGTRETSPPLDTKTARERGAELGEKAAQAANVVSESIEEGRLTAKIKAKMVLDDLVKARTIDVTTSGTTVTVSGTVQSQQERERAVQLAKETEGVTRVVDQLVVRQP
jgi:hypothetical protein